MSRRRRSPAAPKRVASRWTIGRSSAVGIACGLAALLMAALPGEAAPVVRGVYAALLLATALCGASILWITLLDMRSRGTSGRMRPIRAFDGAVGLGLLAPSVYALWLAWPHLLG